MMTIQGCSDYTITTVEEIHLSQDALESRHKPFWCVLWGISVDRNAIRDDITKIMNDVLSENFKRPEEKWAWREGKNLFILNPAIIFKVDPNKIIETFNKDIKDFQNNKADKFANMYCSYFDQIILVYQTNDDGLGIEWKQKNTTLETNRRKYFDSLKSPVLKKLSEGKDF